MWIDCPNCNGRPVIGNDYDRLLELAEAGTLTCTCGTCGYSWKPADQQTLAASIRKAKADTSFKP